jgi:hypothetical protein
VPKPIRTTTEKDEQVQWSRALVKGFAWLSVLLLALEALFLEMLHIWRLAEMLNVWLILKWFSLVLFVCIFTDRISVLD